jgi:peptide/nickel transport system substrate-binding protein
MDATSALRAGKINRREFLRFATLLGVSVPAAYALAGCAPAGAPAGAPAAEGGAAPAAAGGIKRGGTLTSGMLIQKVDHPARMSWVEAANVLRHVGEYLTETGPDNVTRPYLVERWEASDDVKEWTLYLQQGVKFNNGDDFTADDVIFNFEQWLNPDVGSSMLGFLGYIGGTQNIEKVDDYTIKLYLQDASISVPEDLFQYPALIVHRSFEGDFIKAPVGTGPFTLAEYREGERAVLKARTDYWRMGADGSPLPYLDEVIYVNMDKDAAVAAIQSGQIDTFFLPRASDWQALKDVPGLSVYPISTAQGLVGRMRMDLDPWTDNRVRTALKMCQDRQKITELAYFGEGDLALDAHVAPAHPDFAPRDIPAYDPEGAKALLEEYAAEKGIELPLKVTLATKNDLEEPEIAQALKELAAPAGFDIALDITDPGGYWDRWTEVDLGITIWTHRPLGTMVLNAGYSVDGEGNPVPWNETRWTDEEFMTLLKQANGTLDVEARREVLGQIQDIMQERGPIFISFWKKTWAIARSEVKDIAAHPTAYDFFHLAWKDA